MFEWGIVNVLKRCTQIYPNTHFDCSVEGCMIYSAYPELEKELVHMTEFEKMYYGCRAGKSKIEIYADGGVLPCICFENEKRNISNIRKTHLRDIWYNDNFLNLIRRSKGKSAKCMNCGFNVFCNGGCPEKRYRIYGDKFESYSDPDCKMKKIE